MKAFIVSCVLVAGLALPARVAMAQEASVEGAISDATGAALPGVAVTALHVATGNVFTTVSDVNGNYRFGAVRTGIYKITSELTGFNTAVKEGVEVLVGQHIILNLRMELSSVTESVTVT